METNRVALKSITFKIEPELFVKINAAMVKERETEISRFIIEAICDKLDTLEIDYPEYVRLKRSRAGIGGPKPRQTVHAPATGETALAEDKPRMLKKDGTEINSQLVDEAGRTAAYAASLAKNQSPGSSNIPVTVASTGNKSPVIPRSPSETSRKSWIPKQAPTAHGKKT